MRVMERGHVTSSDEQGIADGSFVVVEKGDQISHKWYGVGGDGSRSRITFIVCGEEGA